MNTTTVIKILQTGGVIAYPTESVYGLGCDPMQEQAVLRILQLKNRSVDKGLILIGADFSQFKDYVAEVTSAQLRSALQTWPGPVTWVFPAKKSVPRWITGNHQSVAIRVTDHPVARKLCEAFGGPLISTSANREGEAPALDAATLKIIFADGIDLVVSGDLGQRKNPSEIRDVCSGHVLRKG